MGDRYIKSDENKKILYIDSNNLYGRAMSESLPYDEIKLDKNIKLEDILKLQVIQILAISLNVI